MTYQQVLENIGSSTERAVLRDFNVYLSGRIALDVFVDLAAVTISAAQQQGRYAAEVALMAWMHTVGVATTPVAAPPLEHYRDSERIRKGVGTIVGLGVIDPDETQNRLARLAYAETVEASQRSFGEAMHSSPHVSGWKRAVEPESCELCEHWALGGEVWPTSHTMPTHKGCTCTQVPIKGEE